MGIFQIDFVKSEFERQSKANNCTGLVFKGSSQVYMTNGRITYKQSVRLMKRMSCDCDTCLYMLDSINEDIACDHPPIFPKQIKDGKFYSVRVINESRDWETGIIDDWDTEIFEISKPE